MASLNPALFFHTPEPIQPERPLFVFLPGMDGSGALYGNQTRTLRGEFDIRCLVIPPDDLTPWPGLVSQTVGLIHAARQGRPVYLCAESFGACLALHIIAKAPDLVDRLILVNPASSFSQLPWVHWATGIAPWVSTSVYWVGTLGLLPLLAALHRISDENRQALLKAMQAVSQRSTAWRMELLRQFRAEDLPLRRFTGPTLFVAGQCDRLLPSFQEVQRLATYLPQARTHILPISGHACLLEHDVDLRAILQTHQFHLPEW